MSNKNPIISDRIEKYVTDVLTRQTPVQKRLAEETSKMSNSVMQTTPDQVAVLAMLIKSIEAKHVIEVGVFTGYGSLAMAMALPKDGKLIACDVSTEWTNIAKRYWQEAGVSEQIDLRIAPAQETIAALAKEEVSFDFAFIDADKQNYDAYYEALLKLMRPGGLIAFDNMLWGGDVADDTVQDAQTSALRNLNIKLRDDNRVDACMLTIADGIMLVRKR